MKHVTGPSKRFSVVLTAVVWVTMWCWTSPVRADEFLDKVDLTALQSVACQGNQTIKTADTMARQALEVVTNSASLDGRRPIVTVFDMSLRPELYRDRPLIYITSVPVRKDLQQLTSISTEEKERIVHDGTVSLNFWRRADVVRLHDQIMSSDARKASALDQVDEQAAVLGTLLRDEPDVPSMALIPPGTDESATAPWRSLQDVFAALSNAMLAHEAAAGPLAADATQSPVALAGYDMIRIRPVLTEAYDLKQAWIEEDATKVNARAAQLAVDLPLIRPDVYPSALKRQAEVTYNRLAKLTIPGAMMYVLAFVFFLMGLRSGIAWLRTWGLALMMMALVIHAGGIAIRWWLVGDVFPPIKNEFESVMFSAFFGAVVGLILELRTKKLGGLFGAAASFVGMLAMLALFAAPYVAGRDIGGEIAPVNGVLMSYWLYIHVTMVTASYALIAMGFVLSAWWLIDYHRAYGTLRPSAWREAAQDAQTPPRQGASGSATLEYRSALVRPAGSGSAASSGEIAVLGFWPTLARLVFPGSRGAADSAAAASARSVAPSTLQVLGALDQCNLVVLQLAFWMLGLGICFGAIWADQSWGRPWGWDPKETFALVTWIVYMIAVHVRVATIDKAWWTAALGVIGFFIMLFNWIGVNFWLVGLHSYA